MSSFSEFLNFVIAMLLTSSHFVESQGGRSSPCGELKPTWDINWYSPPHGRSTNQESQRNTAKHVADVMEFLGFAWNANSWLEVLGVACIQYGPLITRVNISHRGAVVVYNYCDNILHSLKNGEKWNFGEWCRDEFEGLFHRNHAVGLSSNIFAILGNCEIHGMKCPRYECGMENLTTEIFECFSKKTQSESLIISLVERWSPLFLNVMDLFGPSVLSADRFALCSTLRLLSGMTLNKVINEMKNILAHFLAESLEYLKLTNFCDDMHPSEYDHVINLTLALYYPNGRMDFCDDLSAAYTRKDFHTLSLFFLDDILNAVDDKKFCPLMLSAVDLFGGIRIDASLCSTLTGYFSCQCDGGAEQGRSFGVTFFEGAFKSMSILDVSHLLCQYFTVTSFGPSLQYAQMICYQIRDIANPYDLEVKCLKTFFSSDNFTSKEENVTTIGWRNSLVRPLTVTHQIAIAFNAVTKVFNLTTLSGRSVCENLGDYFNSRGRSLGSLVRNVLDVFLGELLHAFANVCGDFHDNVCETVFPGVACGDLPERETRILKTVTDHVIPSLIGYDTMDDACSDIIQSIKSHGFVESQIIANLRENIIENFQSTEECLDLIGSAQPLLATFGLPDSVDGFLNATTAFETSKLLCETLTFFMQPPCYGSFTVAMSPPAVTPDLDTEVTFIQTFPYVYGSYSLLDRRPSVGTGLGLPTGSYSEQLNPATVNHVVKRSPPIAKGTLPEAGVYVHSLRSRFNPESKAVITTIVQSSNRITFAKTSRTVYPGDDVTLTVYRPPIVRKYIWRHNGIPMYFWRGTNTVTLKSITRESAGIYEFHKRGRRSAGKHGIMRLIVAVCPKGLVNPPYCNVTSQLGTCLNGGVLRQDADSCICAPGFYGDRCENFFGFDFFGPHEDLSCTTHRCSFQLICKEDPYGCKCAPGYKGKTCTDECPDGYYGTDCEGECHCAEGVTCHYVTGSCNLDRCQTGWTGWNCQDPINQPLT